MAANIEKGEVDLTINDTTYTLVVKTQALMAWQRYFETKDGRPPVDVLFKALAGGSIEHAVALFWASFRRYHPDVTFDKAVSLMDDLGGLPAAQEVMAAFSEANSPDPEDVKELEVGLTRPPTGQDGTGGPSSSTPVGAA